LGCRCSIEPVELSITFATVLLNGLHQQRHALYIRRENVSLIDVDASVAVDVPGIGRGCHDLHLDIEDADVFLTGLSRWRVLDADVA